MVSITAGAHPGAVSALFFFSLLHKEVSYGGPADGFGPEEWADIPREPQGRALFLQSGRLAFSLMQAILFRMSFFLIPPTLAIRGPWALW